MADERLVAALLQQELDAAQRPFYGNPNIAAQGEEIRFQRGIRATPWFSEFVKQYGEEPDLSKSSDYDYRQAWRMGIRQNAIPTTQTVFIGLRQRRTEPC
jgi:hypothetical protein